MEYINANIANHDDQIEKKIKTRLQPMSLQKNLQKPPIENDHQQKNQIVHSKKL